MDLREEIAEIYRERSVMDLTKADKIINKVLDTAVQELLKVAHSQELGQGSIHLVDGIEAIQRLKEG